MLNANMGSWVLPIFGGGAVENQQKHYRSTKTMRGNTYLATKSFWAECWLEGGLNCEQRSCVPWLDSCHIQRNSLGAFLLNKCLSEI